MSNYNPNNLREELETYLFQLKTNIRSRYNSGYETLHYKEEIKKTKAKFKKVGKQLKFKFE